MVKQNVVVIDYGSGNLKSAVQACRHVIARAGFDLDVLVSDRAHDIEAASYLVLPGQGAFGDCVHNLRSRPGLVAALEAAVLVRRVPFLGICVGMQLLARVGYEHGEHVGLGWLDAEIVPLEPGVAGLKIPHMGWNDVECVGDDPVLAGLKTGDHVYCVHSYHMRLGAGDRGAEILRYQYGGPVVAAVAKGNIVGVQFHPEKSSDLGLRLIENFLRS